MNRKITALQLFYAATIIQILAFIIPAPFLFSVEHEGEVEGWALAFTISSIASMVLYFASGRAGMKNSKYIWMCLLSAVFALAGFFVVLLSVAIKCGLYSSVCS